MELTQVVWFWVLVIVTLIVVLIFIVFFIIYCHQNEKTTVVRFASPPPDQPFPSSNFDGLGKAAFRAIVFDNREMIKPKLKFYEPSRLSTPFCDSSDFRGGTGRRGSSRPVSSVSSISQDIKERRLSLSTRDSFDTNITFFKDETRESTPIRPLDPAYESQGPLNISSSSFGSSFLLRQNEIALPPGYVSLSDAKF